MTQASSMMLSSFWYIPTIQGQKCPPGYDSSLNSIDSIVAYCYKAKKYIFRIILMLVSCFWRNKKLITFLSLYPFFLPQKGKK